jgi:hypothetical protein
LVKVVPKYILLAYVGEEMDPRDDQEFLLHTIIREGTMDPRDEDDGSQYFNQSGDVDADEQLENAEEQDEAEVYGFHAYMYV